MLSHKIFATFNKPCKNSEKKPIMKDFGLLRMKNISAGFIFSLVIAIFVKFFEKIIV